MTSDRLLLLACGLYAVLSLVVFLYAVPQVLAPILLAPVGV